MRYAQQRKRLRAILNGDQCVSPASVHDPLSARVAETVGYELGMLAGSVATNTTLAAPDGIGLLTLTEFADQIRRIMRVSNLSLIVDADQGYGNAINVMRAVQELEYAGVSMLSIEDTVLPKRFGREGGDELVSVDEMVGKLRAAVAARRDPALIIAGRTSAMRVEDTARTIARVRAYATTGVDAIFLAGLGVGLKNLGQLEAVQAVCRLPIVLGAVPASFKREDLQARGVRILLQGHQPLAAAVKALHETYTHLFNGGAPADLISRIASAQEMATLVRGAGYEQWQRAYLKGG